MTMRYRELEGMDIDEARKKLGEKWILRRTTTGVLIRKTRSIFEFVNYDMQLRVALFVVQNRVNSVLVTEY